MADDPGLSTAEAAARLGVKRETLYAYVSRGLLTRTQGADGRSSRFDPAEVDRFLHTGRRPPSDGELRTVIATGLTRVDDAGLLVRGRDLVAEVTAGVTFTQAVDLLWASPAGEDWPSAIEEANPAEAAAAAVAPRSPLDALRITIALRSAADALRHDLSPRSVRAVGRSLIVALCRALPPRGPEPGEGATLTGELWCRLTVEPATPARLRALDTALALLVDHGLAGSTFAARIAASVRADPYSVVAAGLAVVGGTLHGAASGAVHELLAEAAATGDTTAAVGAVRRRLGRFPGFGHAVYREQDPRYGALMARVVDAWGAEQGLVTVYRVRDVISQRNDAIPNVDLALGSLTFLARMPAEAGEVIFAIARTAGWLAHAIEEYEEQPLRFRARERYTGPVTKPSRELN
ncbi:MAG: helix-turn-helix domain-containing protein [Acidimicrobiia bacterium]|nr:helix-turn-helix domain-containing protein [Acidimicrobiia bacterium]